MSLFISYSICATYCTLSMAEQVAAGLTGSYQRWTAFLTTAARLYKYPFPEQMMIFAQRPDATACAEYDLWNNTMGRYVRRGSKGIALLDDNGDRPKLRYVFDISDTVGRENARQLYLWQYRPEHEAPVTEALEKAYDIPAEHGLADQLEKVAAQLADEYWSENQRDLLHIVDGSFLEEYDDFNIGVAFRSAATVSITYALMSRCGLEPEVYFEHEDFLSIFDFNTPAVVTALGTAVSQSSQEVLRQIGVTIKHYEYERSQANERTALYPERGLSDSRPDLGGTAPAEAPGQVRQDAENLSEGTSDGALQQPSSDREADSAPAGDRRGSERPSGADDSRAGESGGRNGEPESQRPDALGGPDEQLQGPGGGDYPDGTYQQLTLNLFLSEQEQIQNIQQAESRQPSAFSMPQSKPVKPARPVDTQAAIDAALQEWNGDIRSKQAVVRYMKDHARDKGTAAWLKQEYSDDLPAFPVPAAATDLPWEKVQRRIAQLIKEDRFFTEEEQNRFDDIDPIAIREALEQRGIVGGQVVDAEKLEQDPFIRQVTADAGRIAQEEQAQAPDLSGQPIIRQGDTITIGDDETTHEVDITVSDEEWQQIQDALPDTADRNQQAPPYHVGDTVYLDDTAFEITSIGLFDVQLRDPALSIPIFRAESKERFEQLLQKDLRNGSITEFLSADLSKANDDLREVLTSGLFTDRDKAYISGWLRSGEGNKRISQRLSETFAGRTETMELATGDTADFSTSTTGMEVEIQDKYNTKLGISWDETARLLRTLYQQGLDGLSPETKLPEPAHLEGVPTYKVGDTVKLPFTDREISGTIGYIGDMDVRIDTGPYSWSHETINREIFEERLRQDERNAGLFAPEPAKDERPEFSSETVTVYPGDKNGLPYDVVIERLHVEEPEHDPPNQVPAENFRITDDHLGEGGSKAKFRMNVDAIRTLQEIEAQGRSATPAEQEVLSRYVGWGGLADCFDPRHNNYEGLRSLLTEKEYAAARESTLTAFYTPPVVIHSIYAALGQMGFRQGNVLEPACGIGHFLGMLPDSMTESKLYGVELDNISGRIARQLYPRSSISMRGYEKMNFPDNFFDVAVGNVPFGQFKVQDRRYDRLNLSIHEYFFAKTLDKVRPGGVVAFVTSSYTMDKRTGNVRKYIAQRAELLGAIRLPNDTFKAAAGTEVVSDILFLQKRDRMVDIEPEWVQLGTNDDGITMNRYFLDHPDMVLGEMKMVSGPYGPEPTCTPFPNQPLDSLLANAVQNIHGEITTYEREEELEGEDQSIEADPTVRNFSYTLVDRKLYYRENSRMNPVEVSKTAESRIRGMIGLRDCVRTLLEYQTEDYPESSIREQQAKLNDLYDRFTREYGLINSRGNAIAFDQDSSYFLLCSLEVLDEEGGLKRKADLFTKRTVRSHRPAERVDTAVEALALSIGEKARVDMAYMGQLTGKGEDSLFADLQGVVFLNPDYGEKDGEKYLPADEYLSGNVRRKLAEVRTKAESEPQYQPNVEALEKVQPVDLTASEISVRLGATWLNPEYIRQFIFETLDTPRRARWDIKVHYSQITGEWRIEGKSKDKSNIKAFNTYGTLRASAYEIIESSLNLKDIRIFDYQYDRDGRRVAVLNKKETAIAQGKQELLKEAFAEWIWKDPKRREKICKAYNILFNSNRPREYDGSHINFSGMNPEITLRKHQVNAIAHILYGGNTLLAHVVGAGKTFEMVAAAMESKRLGLCQKSLFVVPNHLTEQWASEFLQLYPAANVLVATKKDFETKNRKKFCGRIATGDYDAVIIGHSQFEKIPVSIQRQRAILEQQMDEIILGIREAKADKAENFTIKQMEKTRKGLQNKLDKLNDQRRKDDVVTFEELGVDRLFIDESHYYKNLFLYTKMRNVSGIAQTEAQKSSDLFMKCRYLDEITGGRGVVFATGTPISNSMVELYTIQRYLQMGALQEQGFQHFDAWAANYGETVTAIELAPEGYTLVGR